MKRSLSPQELCARPKLATDSYSHADEGFSLQLVRHQKKTVTSDSAEAEGRLGSLIKTSQGLLMGRSARPAHHYLDAVKAVGESDAWAAVEELSQAGAPQTAARILRACHQAQAEPSESSLSLDQSLERKREYWWIPAENSDQTAVKFAMRKMNVVVLTEEGVLAHF